VKDFIPTANLYVDAYKVPSRMMHLHQMSVRFKKKAPNKESIVETFRKEFGIAILSSATGTAQVRKKAMELGFPHGDTNMVHIHQEVVRVEEDTVKIPYSDDQSRKTIYSYSPWSTNAADKKHLPKLIICFKCIIKRTSWKRNSNSKGSNDLWNKPSHGCLPNLSNPSRVYILSCLGSKELAIVRRRFRATRYRRTGI
jgi:hypothetical protein